MCEARQFWAFLPHGKHRSHAIKSLTGQHLKSTYMLKFHSVCQFVCYVEAILSVVWTIWIPVYFACENALNVSLKSTYMSCCVCDVHNLLIILADKFQPFTPWNGECAVGDKFRLVITNRPTIFASKPDSSYSNTFGTHTHTHTKFIIPLIANAKLMVTELVFCWKYAAGFDCSQIEWINIF